MQGSPFPAESLLPVFFYFLVGVMLRRTGVARPEHADFLFRVIFLVTLPALIFMSVSGTGLGRDTVLLPIAGFLVNLSCAGAAALIARLRRLPPSQAGAVVICAAIMNMGYMLPFILATRGQAALADAILFDAGNAVFVATLAYPIAHYYGHQHAFFTIRTVAKVMLSPIFLSIVAALVVNLVGLRPGPMIGAALSPLGSATLPLMLIAVGASFTGFSVHSSESVIAVATRMLFGASLGWLGVSLFGFEDATAAIVVVCAAAPVGASAAAISVVSDLNRDIAVNSISMSALIGLFSTSALLYLASGLFG